MKNVCFALWYGLTQTLQQTKIRLFTHKQQMKKRERWEYEITHKHRGRIITGAFGAISEPEAIERVHDLCKHHVGNPNYEIVLFKPVVIQAISSEPNDKSNEIQNDDKANELPG